MFYECSSVQSIDLSSFNATNVNNMDGIFLVCSSLKNESIKIKVTKNDKLLKKLKVI